MKKKTFPVTNIGSVSLLMIFIVLCLVTFATLSLSSAASDYQYSRRTADHNTQYYEACSKASLTLRKIDGILDTAWQENPENFYGAAALLFEKEADIDADFKTSAPVITFYTRVNDTKELAVVLTLNDPSGPSRGFYRITTWQEISSVDWEGSDTLKLIDQ